MTPLRAAACLSALALIGACKHAEEHSGPAGIAYSCGDGRTARIFFGGGDPTRAAARLEFDGREHEVRPAPAMSGLRYVSESGLVWSAEGDSAVVGQLTQDPAASEAEREIARCTRLRDGDVHPPDGAQGG